MITTFQLDFAVPSIFCEVETVYQLKGWNKLTA